MLCKCPVARAYSSTYTYLGHSSFRSWARLQLLGLTSRNLPCCEPYIYTWSVLEFSSSSSAFFSSTQLSFMQQLFSRIDKDYLLRKMHTDCSMPYTQLLSLLPYAIPHHIIYSQSLTHYLGQNHLSSCGIFLGATHQHTQPRGVSVLLGFRTNVHRVGHP